MADRAQTAEHRGIADEDIEAAVALMQRGAQLVDQFALAKVERHQHGGIAAAGGADFIVCFFEAAGGARHQNEPRAFGGEALRHRAADAARGAGHQGDAAVKSFAGHGSNA